MLFDPPGAFGGILREQQQQSMQVGARQATSPVAGMARSMIAELLCACWHARPERFGESGERGLIDAECAQPVAGEPEIDVGRGGRARWGVGKNHAMNIAKVSTLLDVLPSHRGPARNKTDATGPARVGP